VVAVAGLLLTGGAGRRLGRDKAGIEVGGERLGDRGARVLAEVCDPVLEVGPGRTSLEPVVEDPPGSGPLAAVAAGGRALAERGQAGPALVLAVDMPLVDAGLLRFLAGFPGRGSVVPFVEGRAQPLCARYSPAALATAGRLVEAGERAMRSLLEATGDLQWAGPRMWGEIAVAEAFLDLDTAEDLARLREISPDMER
jgi:molybdopterin-guanine dinucleotide biosynthesis protein A